MMRTPVRATPLKSEPPVMIIPENGHFPHLLRRAKDIKDQNRSFMSLMSFSSLLAQGAQQAFRLVPGLGIFLVGVGIRDDAAADGEVQPALAVHQGANEQVGIHPAVEAEPAEAAA